MRLWSLSFNMLDKAGLGALWREGLLALNVLKGNTKGYKNHPQLDRFKQTSDPLQAINTYLHLVCDEAVKRNYKYDRSKLLPRQDTILPRVSYGQVKYEYKHLYNKIKNRSPKDLNKLSLNWKKTAIVIDMLSIDFKNQSIETWERI